MRLIFTILLILAGSGLAYGAEPCADFEPGSVRTDAQGNLYCFAIEGPKEITVGKAESLRVRVYHPSGISTLSLAVQGLSPLADKTLNKNCSGQTECFVEMQVQPDHVGLALVYAYFYKSTGAFVQEAYAPISLVCQGQSCPLDPEFSAFFQWMRRQGYGECVTSRYLEFSQDARAVPVMKTFLRKRSSQFANPQTLHFYDIVPTDPEASFRTLASGEGGFCKPFWLWPSWCSGQEVADLEFMRKHFARTYGVEFEFIYHRVETNYAQTFGAPILQSGKYRFPNSRYNFTKQFPDHAIVRYAMDSFHGLPIYDMTGGSHVVEVNVPLHDQYGIQVLTHEWGHTWGLPHSFYGDSRVPSALDGVMNNVYRLSTPLIDPLDPLERYVFQPQMGFVDQITFASTYSRGLTGSMDLPVCGKVDPQILLVRLLSQTEQTAQFEVFFRNNGPIPIGYVPFAVYSGTSIGKPLLERSLWQMPTYLTFSQKFSVPLPQVQPKGQRSGSLTLTFVLDPQNVIRDEVEANNVFYFRH